ncbi:A disintegrin and metalloproteinase with thrombospondin motifs 9 isoform X2 [Anoplophora glabripennis]|uniref:A disintegrin and metalloproteinase with thrombospondin motifs 9 isoform X2 n=1 Tax=Anoplophora glabripennis TaxID=217634 RepID=UPI000873EF6E|nr:A disintegrin and metalloproteinase with thrombospondin motifs 9 isoform X2 [Anoplophora glabripennis]
MTTKFARRCTSVLACVAIVVLGAIIVVVWVQFSQGAFKNKQQYNVLNVTTTTSAQEGPRHLNRSRHKEYIERTHLEDLGHSSDVEFVKPLKISPLPLHDHDILYDKLHNNHDNPVLRHHSGHFRHRTAEVWDPHPQYEIDAFDRKLLLELEHNSKFVAPGLHIINHIWDNHTQRVKHDPKMSGCFYTGQVRGDPGSSVVVSLCHGMTGYIRTSESNYYIEPAEKFANGTLGSLIHRIKRLPHPPKDTNDVVNEPEESWDSNENRTIIEDDYEIVERHRDHIRKKREIVVDEETKTAYIETCDIDTDKDYSILDELSRATREIEWGSYAKTSQEYFVKVLVVADESMVKYHVRDDDLHHYILTLMSHVSLIYKDATIGNAISIAVVKIAVLKNNDFANSNSQDMLRKFCEWQQNNIWQKTHDVAVLLTRNTICKNSTANLCNTLGVAEVGSMCRPSSCAIVKDKGLASSYTIAHELGHVLSMPHDEDRKCEQYNKGKKQNNIMNKMLKNDTKPFMWSPCSRHIVTEFLDSRKAKCLNNPPDKDLITSSHTKILPGDKFEVDRQCELEFGPESKVCPFQPPCGQLWCTTDIGKEGCKTQWSPWAEGTKCGDRSWCFRRQCIPENRQHFIPIDGGWGPWQDWGPCSRTCGGGIQTSQRYCDSPEPVNGGNYCIGENVRYASCNTMDCESGTDDFRAVQCAEFNGITKNLPNLTSNVEWVPKYGLEQIDDMCKLYCRPKDSNAYYLLKSKVLDGTKCGLTSFNICVNGNCRPGGCDNKLESKMDLDDCGICGGDNSRCQEISGTYNKPADTSGYNRVVRIPKGSSNINITQDPYPYANDENYLVLIDGETGIPILNGNYIAITHETDVIFGSLIIKYSGTNATVEWITTPKNHKLTKDLVLSVLSVGKLTAPHITYRYVINKDEAPSYGWRLYQKQWSKCNSICDGKQYRKPVCVELTTGGEVPNGYCDAMDESVVQKQECNTHCELTWNIASKSPCSSPCGKGYRQVHYDCMKVYKKPSYSEIVNEKHCSVLARPPMLERCDSVCNSTRWDYSPWSECTKTCGGGIQRRTAKCVDDKYTPIDDSYCNNSEMITEQICNTERCPNWTWAETSSCSAPCGGGYQNVTYYCVLDGRIYEYACDINSRPPIRVPCNEQACGRWAASDTYHMCSVTCGKGTESRKFICKKFNSEEVLHDDYCRDLPVPDEKRACYRGSCENLPNYKRPYKYNNDFDNSIVSEIDNRYDTFEWIPGEWSSCSQTCGGGMRTQISHCVNELGHEDKTRCDSNLKPSTVNLCNTQPCPKWMTGKWSPSCDSNCERRRQVTCVDYTNVVVDGRECDQSHKPDNSTRCKLSECPNVNRITEHYGGKGYRWKVGAWKQCSAHCGRGTKTRNVTCHRVHHGGIVDPNPLPDIYMNKIHHKNYCSLYNKPTTTAECTLGYCGDKYVWHTEPWRQCSQRCGKKGKQLRAVHCVNLKTKEKVSRNLCRKNLKPTKRRKCNQTKCLNRSCKEVKTSMKTKENKDYFISIHGRPVQIYCYKMDTPEPQEYISLHPDARNYAEIYDKRLIDVQSCPYDGQRKDSCHCDAVGTDRSGFTKFWKVRLNITSMKIIGDDFTFSKQIKGRRIAFGTAGDCYSSVRGCAQGRFSVDLTHTSFKLAKNVRWEEIGSYASSEIYRQETVASGKCGGYCGNCVPDPDIGLAVEIT